MELRSASSAIIDIFHFPRGLRNNIVNTHQYVGQEYRLSAMYGTIYHREWEKEMVHTDLVEKTTILYVFILRTSRIYVTRLCMVYL